MKIRVKIIAALILGLAFALGGCSKEGTCSGLVIASGGNPEMFEVQCDNGEIRGFVINDETELIWEDKSAFSIWENVSGDYDDWDVFGCDMIVNVEAGEKTEYPDGDGSIEEWFFAKKVTVTGVEDGYFTTTDKPVIYLYPEEETDVEVRLDYDGVLTCTYPKYDGVWQVTAQPDGTLTDSLGKNYSYLYWEGICSTEYDFSEGFCVAGEDTAEFLEDALSRLGLTRREANEFIVYWLPQMEGNEYNIISFQNEAYTDSARLTVSPQPDTVIRVFMAWKPSESEVSLPEQTLSATERDGFTLVEWGGTEVISD